jgi:hypothetical protein
MGRKSKKAGIYGQYSYTKVEEAVAEYRAGRLSLRKASSKFGVPRSTISDHALGKVLPGAQAGDKAWLLFTLYML